MATEVILTDAEWTVEETTAGAAMLVFREPDSKSVYRIPISPIARRRMGAKLMGIHLETGLALPAPDLATGRI
jgi:hypothetical protein